jgi:subtilisin family serine protease
MTPPNGNPRQPNYPVVPGSGKGLKQITLPPFYPPNVHVNYPLLIKKNLHLAEIYRVGSIKLTGSPADMLRLNPFQVQVDPSNGDVWVDVLLELQDGVSFRELYPIMQVHGKPGQSRIISGRIKTDNLPLLREKAARIETSRPVSKTLNKSLKFIKAGRNQFLKTITSPIDGSQITGAGVIIGIIDDGCDFNHPNFKKPNGETRLLALWDQSQNIPNRYPASYPYGAEFDAVSINAALNANIHNHNPDDAYGLLGYTPIPDAHGTHSMDIAAGSSPNLKYLGVAPEADLIFVHLGSPSTPKEVADEERGTFGSSKYLVDAFNYILDKAGDQPVVINMSLATNGGAHNGRSLTDAMFEEQLRGKKRTLVIAAGNAAKDAIHSSKLVKPNQECEFIWHLPGVERANESSWYARYEMEIWYPLGKQMKVEIYKPNAALPLLTCAYDEEQMNDPADLQPLALVTNSTSVEDAENHVDVLIDHRSSGFEVGDWRIRLVNQTAEEPALGDVTFHAWIERNDEHPSWFAANSDNGFTINGIGTAHLPIVVGAYDDSTQHHALEYSSFGPSRNTDFSDKPEISAPGENITSASARNGNTVSIGNVSADKYTERTSSEAMGTSAAAPHVTGVIALMFHAAKLSGRDNLTVEDIRSALIETTISDSGSGHHHQLGYGRINALEAIKRIISH